MAMSITLEIVGIIGGLWLLQLNLDDGKEQILLLLLVMSSRIVDRISRVNQAFRLPHTWS